MPFESYFREFDAKFDEALPDALKAAGEVIRADAVDRAPKLSGRLAESAKVNEVDDTTVSVTFDGPYARKQHEDSRLKHPRGGQWKYLERAGRAKSSQARDAASAVLRRAL